MRIRNTIKKVNYGPHKKTESEGEVKYLKGNQFDEDFQLTLFNNSFVHIYDKDHKHKLEENDVILAAKGFRNFAWKYTSEYGDCIASSLFYVIKLDMDVIDPDYFTMSINSPRIQHVLKNIGLGATIPAIPKNELLRIDIAVPAMQEQKKAVAIHKLLNEQIRLERKILQRRINIKNGLLNLLTENTQ